MQTLTRQSFLEKAEDRLAGIRGSLLLFAQGRLSPGDLAHADRRLAELGTEAQISGLEAAARLAVACSQSIEQLASSSGSNRDTYVNRSLDLLSRLEAELLQMPLSSNDFLSDVNDLVESSFEYFKRRTNLSEPARVVPEPEEEDFEIDEETLEIFRSEAEGLLANISSNLRSLGRVPDDTNALWEIRRNAHTFKGAAGIIGFRDASQLAHRIEDLLDKMVESRCSADGRVIDLLAAATGRLEDMASGKYINEDPAVTAQLSADFESVIASVPTAAAQTPAPAAPTNGHYSRKPVDDEAAVSTPTPIVRVSLDRLDDLLKVSRDLLVNRSALAERFAELKNNTPVSTDNDPLSGLDELIDAQHRLSDEILQMLLRIRMVRFGTLEMRLNRAVHMTCQDESKQAFVVLENPDLEIDTQVIDAMIEPLLHLLKNAVVHGIEPTETRRLLGKDEKGRIRIAVREDETDVYLTVSDDGNGISTAKLLEKAIASGIIDEQKAESMDEASIIELIFDRGLTTAESVNLNAGRGVGMCIVKESVESRGGTVTVETVQQKGTRFTIRLPLTLRKPEAEILAPAPIETPVEPDVEMPPLVLIVDDSPSIRRMTARIIEDAGFRTITAEHGAEALELLLSGEWEPDLIFSDVEMPVMDGWEFLEYVKTDDNFGHIPVVMATSLSSDEYREKASGLGASAYIVKPFCRQELDRVVEAVFRVSALVGQTAA